MLNFTVGPVMCSDQVCAVGGEQVPYFRTPEFSAVMLENEQLMLKFSNAPEGSRVAFMTNSATASWNSARFTRFRIQSSSLIMGRNCPKKPSTSMTGKALQDCL